MAENTEKKKATPAEELAKAIEKARKAGLNVRASASEVDENGVTTNHTF